MRLCHFVRHREKKTWLEPVAIGGPLMDTADKPSMSIKKPHKIISSCRERQVSPTRREQFAGQLLGKAKV